MSTPVKKYFDKLIEYDKKFIAYAEKKLGLSDFQSKCLSFATGFVIAAVLV
tara:strand:- start:3409 stop:3561 length:153 start_codon:yes stop_codon:yes gene_type:complete